MRCGSVKMPGKEVALCPERITAVLSYKEHKCNRCIAAQHRLSSGTQSWPTDFSVFCQFTCYSAQWVQTSAVYEIKMGCFFPPTKKQKNKNNKPVKFVKETQILNIWSCILGSVNNTTARNKTFVYLLRCFKNLHDKHMKKPKVVFNHLCSQMWNTVKIFLNWVPFYCWKIHTGRNSHGLCPLVKPEWLIIYWISWPLPIKKKPVTKSVVPFLTLCFLSSNNRCLFMALAPGSQ